MPRQKQKLIILLSVISIFLPLYYISAGTVLSTHKYAWSNNVGYINFEGVTVGDSALSGYAWSTNKGLIKFNPVKGGVLNDGTGNLSGFAWGEQLGWIDFDNVSINGTTGRFSGTATGTLVGTITFDCPNYCDVRTDWRQVTVTPSGGGGGGRLPSVNINPASLNNALIPNVPLNARLFPATNPPQGGVPAASSNIPPLFDIISEPVQATTSQGTIPPIVLSIIAGVFISMSALFVMNRVIMYRMAKGKIKNETI